MSEKRFVGQMCMDKLLVHFEDRDSGQNIPPIATIKDMEIVDLLNEQQATIEQLKQSQDVKEFSALFNQSIALKREIKDLKEENEKLTKMLNANYKTNNELVQYIQMLESDNDE